MNSVVRTADRFRKTTGPFLHNFASSLDPGRMGRLLGHARFRAAWAVLARAGPAVGRHAWATAPLPAAGPPAHSARLGRPIAGLAGCAAGAWASWSPAWAALAVVGPGAYLFVVFV